MIEPSSLELSIQSRYENVALVGWSVHKIACEAGLDDTEAYQVEVCVVEAVNNAIKHAYEERPDQRVEVAIDVESNRLSFCIRDSGRSMPERPVPDLMADPSEEDLLSENGRGMLIMHSFMDEIRYSSVGGRNELQMVRHLPSQTTSASQSTAALGAC